MPRPNPRSAAEGLSDTERQRLTRAVWAAWENNDTDQFVDGQNRRWFVGFEVHENHTTILVQARRGQVIREHRLSTSIINPETVGRAVADIDGAFP
jgi:hypothetical protein